MNLYDFSKTESRNGNYGGLSGNKAAIVFNDENWFLKFPKSMRDFRVPASSYTTSPLSEYIGSHIYSSLGIPVHETQLGAMDGKAVVACKDFRYDGRQRIFDLEEYREIKNAYSREIEKRIDSGSITEKREIILNDVLQMIEINPTLTQVEGIKERFWDMFVVDAFIGNNDRNNGNWGLLRNINTDQYYLAPVYDNGNSFSSSARESQIEKILSSKESMFQSAIASRQCPYHENDKPINPLRYIESCTNKSCNSAVLRFFSKFDKEKIKGIIDEIPNRAGGVDFISDIRKEFYKEVLDLRLEKIFEPTRDHIISEINLGHDVIDSSNCLNYAGQIDSDISR